LIESGPSSPSGTLAKLLEPADLAARLVALRAGGKRIVLAHGVFDLLHIGHIRHLQEARTFGDVLVVTLTEDRHVNKGPHRPAFPEGLRAEAIAALDVVDFVSISRFPSAVEMIELTRPSVYVKGPDYKQPSDDVTGGITREEDAVRGVGGEIKITEDLTFSSSTLINRFLPAYSTDVQAYLDDFRQRFRARDVREFLDRLATMRVVVVGEAILDEYVYCDQLGKSAKEPVLAMRYDSAEMFAGGSLAVANHLAGFCASVELVTCVGSYDGQERFIRSNLQPNVRLNFVYKGDSPTIVKRRYVEKTLLSKLFEVYFINDAPLGARDEADFASLLGARLHGADAVVVSDFGHGLVTPDVKRQLETNASFLAVNTQINASNIRYHAISSYRRADYVCINEGELRLDARDRVAPLEMLVGDLTKKMSCERVLVTRGQRGVEYFADDSRYASPSFAGNVVDRVGSGDAVLALSAVCVAAGVPSEAVAFIANVIGAQKVQTMGNRAPVERAATHKFVEALLK
jgi:rfaE bifunctional protein kinase chain/domain/rfaE bifunctional protein nucleotidyltransferase chain/domain